MFALPLIDEWYFFRNTWKNRKKKMKTMMISLSLMCTSSVLGQITMDGALDTSYGSPNIVQNTQTGFGDSTLGLPGIAEGSELDAGHILIENGYLYIFLAGNLQSNHNKLEVFIDARDGGQNRLRNDNPDVDFDGLNRMGDDGSGNGLTFDAGFDPDMWVSLTCGDTVFTTHASYGELRTDGAGSGIYLGSGSAGAKGVIESGLGIKLAIENSNVGGVGFGEGIGCGEGVSTGVEIAIPLYLFDWDGQAGDISTAKVCAFISSSDHTWVSNQILGGLSGSENLGEPRDINFESLAGAQFFTMDDSAGPCQDLTGACCFGEDCNDLSGSDCAALAGDYQGDGSFCNSDPGPCAPEPCEGDVDGDGMVNVSDLLRVISNWGCTQ